jgi:hypothetical protein
MAPIIHTIPIHYSGDTLLILTNPRSTLGRWNNKPYYLLAAGDQNSQNPHNSDEDDSSEASEIPHQPPVQHEFHYQVSSYNLIAASKMFKKMLSPTPWGAWQEAKPTAADGLKHVITRNFDPKALEYILRIIHDETHQIPLNIDVYQLTNI